METIATFLEREPFDPRRWVMDRIIEEKLNREIEVKREETDETAITKAA